MTAMYCSVEFQHTFPNDWMFDENESPIAPGARELAETVAAGLREQVEDVSPVEQHEYFGWGFTSAFESETFYNVLNPIDGECHLTFSMDWYLVKAILFQRPRDRALRYRAIVDCLLRGIPEISGIAWEE